MAVLSDAGLNFFGSFLIEKGIIEESALIDALRYQEDMNFRIGELAIQKGYLKPEHVEQIYAEQKNVDMPFGTLALTHRLLSRAQLDDLLFSQTVHSTHLGEALLVRGHLTQEQFDASLKEYNEMFQKRQEIVRETLRNFPDGIFCEAALNALDKTFIRFTHSDVKLGTICGDTSGLRFSFCCTVSLSLLDFRSLDVEVYFSEDVAGELARPDTLPLQANQEPDPDIFADFFTIFQRYVHIALRDKTQADAQPRFVTKCIGNEEQLRDHGVHLLLITPSGSIVLRVVVHTHDGQVDPREN